MYISHTNGRLQLPRCTLELHKKVSVQTFFKMACRKHLNQAFAFILVPRRPKKKRDGHPAGMVTTLKNDAALDRFLGMVFSCCWGPMVVGII